MSYHRGSRSTAKQVTIREARTLAHPRPAPKEGEWCASIVCGRLYEACRTLRRAVGHVGPREYGNAMPDVLRSPPTIADMIEQMHDENLHKVDVKIEITVLTAEISRMEEAIHWPGTYLVDQWPGACEVLKLWMRAIATGGKPSAALKAAGFSKVSAQMFLDRAFGEIAAGLARDGVMVEEAGDGIF